MAYSNIGGNSNTAPARSQGVMLNVTEFHISDDWTMYAERLNMHFVAASVPNEKKSAVLLTSISNEVYKLLRGLCFPHVPTEVTFERLTQLLGSHFKAQVCIYRERMKFYEAKQSRDESVNDWLCRLKQIAINCDFGNILNDVLRDKFITGLLKGPVLDKGLEMDANESLEKCVESIIRREASMKLQFEEIHKISKSHGEVEKRSYNGKTQRGNSRCFACGKSNHEFNKCKYRQYVCKICSIKGHLAVMCKKKIKNTVQYLKEEEEETLYSINCGVDNDFEIETTVNQQNVIFQIDTGSSVTCISEKLYNSKFNNMTLKPYTQSLRGYANEKIKPIGVFQATIVIGTSQTKANILVIRNGSRPLIGRDVLKALQVNVLQINNIMTNKINEVLSMYKDIFSEELGHYTYTKVNLKLKNDQIKPKFLKARTVPLAFREQMDQELDRLVEKGVISPINFSEWATPLVPVIKQDGTIRLCADYKITLNANLEDVNYPMPLIEELFAALQGGRKFTKLDLKEAYTQVEVDEETSKLLTWNTHKGLFKVNRLVYGTKPNTAIFQQIMDKTMKGLKGVVCLLDDILITGKNEDEHIENVRAVFERLKQAGLKLKKEKCKFFQDQVKYLGHIVDANGLRKDPEKLQSIKNVPRPTNHKEIRAFIGMVNYYAKFIPNLSSILTPLFKLLRKEEKFIWDEKCEAAFNYAKKKLVDETILTHFNPKYPIKVTCDASGIGIGACLSQQFPDGNMKPITFVSRTLTAAEKNYSVLDREALAIYYAVKKFLYYLLGRKFILVTDHQPLKTIFGQKRGIPPMAAGRLQRWNVFLSNFDFEVEYIKGTSNLIADCLSRLPMSEAKIGEEKLTSTYLNFVNTSFTNVIDEKQVRIEARHDPILARVIEFVNKGWPTHNIDTELKPFYNKACELTIERGVLMWGYRVVIPVKLRKAVIKELHSAHTGMVKMKSIARSLVWWPKVDDDIEKCVNNCTVCLKYRQDDKKSIVIPWPNTEFPFQRIHIDFMGPFKGNTYLIVLDAHSKWTEAFKMKTISAEETVERIRECCARFGVPQVIVSDCGTQFMSNTFQSFCTKNGIKHIPTAPYHPASNGAAENAVKTFKMGLTKAMDDRNNMGESLTTLENRFLMKYRSTVHSTTGETPFKRMFNREMRTRLDIIRPYQTDHVKVVQRHIKDNTKKKLKLFEINERVLAKDFRQQKTIWTKGTVKEKIGRNVFIVQTIDGLKWKRHANQLRKWLIEEEDSPKQGTVLTEETINPRTTEILMRPQRERRPIERLTYT